MAQMIPMHEARLLLVLPSDMTDARVRVLPQVPSKWNVLLICAVCSRAPDGAAESGVTDHCVFCRVSSGQQFVAMAR